MIINRDNIRLSFRPFADRRTNMFPLAFEPYVDGHGDIILPEGYGWATILQPAELLMYITTERREEKTVHVENQIAPLAGGITQELFYALCDTLDGDVRFIYDGLSIKLEERFAKEWVSKAVQRTIDTD